MRIAQAESDLRDQSGNEQIVEEVNTITDNEEERQRDTTERLTNNLVLHQYTVMVDPLLVRRETTEEEKTSKRKLEDEFLEGEESNKKQVRKHTQERVDFSVQDQEAVDFPAEGQERDGIPAQDQERIGIPAQEQERVDFQEPEDDLPQEVRIKFQQLGYNEEAVLVIKKELSATDVDKNANRFLIPEGQIRSGVGVFTAEEEAKLSRKEAIGVQLIDPHLRVLSLKLNKWDMKKTRPYVLIGGWNKEVVMMNQDVLRRGNKVQLWVARRESELCFALVVVGEE